MDTYLVRGADIIDVEIVDGNYVIPQPQLQNLSPKTGYSQAQPHLLPLQQQQKPPQHRAPPHQNFAPSDIASAPAPPSFVQAPPPSAMQVRAAAAKPSLLPLFEDPAIVSMSRNPSILPAAAKPHLGHPPSRPNFGMITPTWPPALPVPAAMSRPGSHDSRKGFGAPLNTVNVAGIPAADKSSLARASGASLENSRVGSDSAAGQQRFSDTSLRHDVTESSAFETDGPVTPLPAKPTYQPWWPGKKPPQRGNAPPRNDQLVSAAQKSLQPSVVLQPGLFGGGIAAAAGAGYGAHKKKSKRRPRHENGNFANDEEGWATEDVTDFKEMEFDFQGNLDRFDKKTVFSQIKAEDTTADEARLVSFNRLPKWDKAPERKNYRNNENVLNSYPTGQSLADRDSWGTPDSAAGLLANSDEGGYANGVVRGHNFGPVGSGRNFGPVGSGRRAMPGQSVSSLLNSRQSSTTGQTAGDNPQTLSSSGGGIAGKSGKPSFRLAPSGRPCPTVSPLQMLDVERIAEVEIGLTDDMMTENGGRGTAQVAIQAFGKRISSSNHNALPVVLVFAGNNKSGARAIAAGRHLKNHHVRVMACVLGLEREDELLENVRRQLNIFRNVGGRVASWPEMQNSLKGIDSPPELIIDGLLGWHLGFEDLRTDHRATAFELVQFANKGRASVLSVDIPSGVDGTSGIYSSPRSPLSSYVTNIRT